MKKILYILIIFSIIFVNISYASDIEDTNSIINDQIDSFGIQDFLKEAKKYENNYSDEIDVNEIFNSAISGNIDNSGLLKKISKIFLGEIVKPFKILISIILILLIHSLLKSITDGLKNSEVSKIVYYVQYILIVTIMMTSFSDIISDINETIENLIGFSETLIPILTTLMIYTGSISTTSVLEPVILFLIEFISNFIKNLVMPILSLIVVIIIISKISNKININKLASFMKSSIVWLLGIVLTIFTGVLSLEGTLTASVDGITAKTTKAVVSNLIPVVRKSAGRQCGYSSWVWISFKKRSWNSWSYYNNKYVHNSNN